MDGAFSKGFEAVTRLVRCREFGTDLSEAICTQGPERGIEAMHREYFPPVRTIDLNEPLPPDHYRAPCVYEAPPSMEKLGQMYSGVSGDFDGCVWKPYSSRIRTNVTPGDRIFRVKHFDRIVETEEVIAWGIENDLVPAMGHNEAHAFSHVQRLRNTKSPVVSLGSFVLDRKNVRMVAVLFGDSNKLNIGLSHQDRKWARHYQFLFLCV